MRREMVFPVHWHAVDDERWSIDLRCGECGLYRRVIATNAQAHAFDHRLGEQLAKIDGALARLDAERMAGEIDAFVEALDLDLIDAADFYR